MLLAGIIAPDVDPPETAVGEPVVRKARVVIEFAADEPGSTFECRLDGAPFTPCSSPRTYRGLKPGRHQFAVQATDVAGNLEDKPDRLRFRIEGRPGPRR